MPGALNELYHIEDFDRCWPSWQEEIEGRSLVHVEVPCSIESLFEALFHSNAPFQKRAQDARRMTDVQESPWVESVSELPGLPSSFNWPDFNTNVNKTRKPTAGTTRKVLFTCPGNALHPSSFRTEQVESCRRYTPGTDFTVEVCVLSSPIYCDRFRPIVKYTAISIDSGNCCLSIDYQLIYVEKVNFVLRRFIEGSARSGIEDNFQKWLEALREFYLPLEVIDLKSAEGKRVQKGCRQRKELKSHRLDDFPKEYVEYDDLELSSDSSGLTLLTLVLLFVRFVVCALALMHWCLDVVTFIPRKLTSLVYWSTVLNWVVTGLIAFSAYLMLAQQLIGLLEGFEGAGSCVSFGNLFICFAVSITTGLRIIRRGNYRLIFDRFYEVLSIMSFLMQAFRAPSHLNYRKKRTPQITQDATGLQAVVRDPTIHKIPPLHVFCCQENVAAAAELIAQGADVNETDTMGNTALHVAAAHGCQEAMILLIGNGANPTLCNKNGRRPSDVVCAKLNDKRKRHAISGLLSLSEMRFEVDNRKESFNSLHEPYCLDELINSRLRIAETTRRFETATKHRRNNEKLADQCTSPVLRYHD